MQFDNGEVLQGLASKWMFLGATLMEWGCGIVMFFIVSLFGSSPVSAMPFMLGATFFTAYSLASLRRAFPDEERGVRNSLMTSCGFAPQDIPAPSALQPLWSGSPVRDLPADCAFVSLGLVMCFPQATDSWFDVSPNELQQS